MSLLPVGEALRRVIASVPGPLDGERLPLHACRGRTLAEDVQAQRTQPPFPASAMDGYAVRAAEASAGARLALIGESAAGRRFEGGLDPGQAVRIFTGAPVPAGADAILIQENATRDGDVVVVREQPAPGRFVRRAGLDFTVGDVLLPAGRRLDGIALALAAAGGHATLPVRRRPRVGILATGDELVRPGDAMGPDQIVASNPYAVAALAEAAGAQAIDFGIAPDDRAGLRAGIDEALAARIDVLVTLGGASVGEHDLVREVLGEAGLDLGFWRIAMRPGKPLVQGRIGNTAFLGLPGNPVSSIVCAILFLVPLLRALQGDPDAGADPTEPAMLGADVPGNDARQDYPRVRLEHLDPAAFPRAVPLAAQDSSMLRLLADAEALLVRPPHAPPASAGDACRIIRLDRFT
ncbi:molybdopterin molybdotransferase MoeA [Salinarimonas soli]|uniref:Molybdopterin molybdenumtransferase n=1 Tax=Salinarimonas soli TaxID=1638099 RepID=A0A5B2VZ27_9HYPH|nr:gephyrin-like molybdotransferase Glp [Salinarimonas soli]KAA2243928.1 molybdopterin molybdotransferase MoeA [Salinarimonas soli]